MAYHFLRNSLFRMGTINSEAIIDYTLNTAYTLLDFGTNITAVLGCILYPTFYSDVTTSDISDMFGDKVSNTALGMFRISEAFLGDDEEENIGLIENILEDSPQVSETLCIKSAENINLLQSSAFSDRYKQMVARNSLNVFVVLARRHGIGDIKGKLEDLCLKHLRPGDYNYILSRLDGNVLGLKDDLDMMLQDVSKILLDNDVDFTITGRVKNIYSIFIKLANGKRWEDIYDILALRIMVNDIDDCRRVANLIHSEYPLLPNRFKDYIATPKDNMYQSIHTTVLGKGDKYYEIQIRTKEMHKIAEQGSACHSTYKENEIRGHKL